MPDIEGTAGIITFLGVLGGYWKGYKKNVNTTQTTTLRQEDSLVYEEDLYVKCIRLV